jgi:hypothetical protein
MAGRFRHAVLCLVLTWSTPVFAGPHDVRLLPTQLEPRAEGAALQLEPVAQRLESELKEALLDFGLTPLEPLAAPQARDEESLIALAHEGWVVSPELGLQGSEVRLRLSVVSPGSALVLVRVQRIQPSELEVRSLGMLRELLEPPSGLPREPAPAPTSVPLVSEPVLPRPRSTGRVVLALHTAALGGYIGYSLQRASGSNDARLTYPLAALGAGIGLGSAVIVADEWDITLGRAWFLGAAMLWPAIGIALVSQEQAPDRHLLGVVGAVGGLTLATVGLALGHVDEGGAALTHSGAVLGLVLGGLGEMIVNGDAASKPTQGIGYGILAGVTAAGALATQVHAPSPTDMLTIDLSALLGGLGGAALGTPLLVSQERSARRDRIWLTGVMAGTVAGAGVGYWITRNAEAAPAASSSGAGLGTSLRLELGSPATPLGLAVSGEW